MQIESLVFLSLFLIFCLAIGIIQGRKVTSFESYFLSRGHFGSAALTCTIIASFIGGGSILGTIEKSYFDGFYPFCALLGFVAQLTLVGIILPRHLSRMGSVVTIGDLLDHHYGNWAKKLVAALWALFSFGILSVQIKGMGQILAGVSELSLVLCILISGFCLIFYCSIGGIRAVVYTDVLQFITMFIILPLGLWQITANLNDTSLIGNAFDFAVFEQPGSWNKTALVSAFIGFLAGDALIPPVMQRILIAKNPQQVRSTFYLGAFGAALLILTASCIGVILSKISSVSGEEIMQVYFASLGSHFMKALSTVGLFAVVISSADTYLNATAVMIVKDLIGSSRLSLGQLVTILIGSIAIAISLFVPNLFDMLLFVYKFWGPIVVVPVTALIINKPLTSGELKISIALSITTVVGWNILDLETLWSISDVVAGIGVSLVVFLASQTRWVTNKEIKFFRS